MPKYSDYKVFNHYLYFTSHCIVEAMHVHAGDEEMSEDSSAKFFVKADGSSVMKRRGDLSRKEQVGIQRYIHQEALYVYVCQMGAHVQAGLFCRQVTIGNSIFFIPN